MSGSSFPLSTDFYFTGMISLVSPTLPLSAERLTIKVDAHQLPDWSSILPLV
jgi:hypothetical protein